MTPADRGGDLTPHLLPYLLLAAVSGVPALVYQVVWTREVALVVGSQIEAVALVVAAFFGGLALGARVLGAAADRSAHPLLLYARLEAGAAAAGLLSIPLLRGLGGGSLATELDTLRPLLAGALVVPTTFLLGGTLPALLRAAHRGALAAARAAGALVGANTAGAVLGVAAAVAAIPELGLRRTFTLAAFGGFALAALALTLDLVGRSRAEADAEAQPVPAETIPLPLLAAAGAAGLATLATEVLAARAAALRLGSSLDAWGLVLAIFLAGLAAGNALFARRAGQTATPLRDLGLVEAAAALLLAAALGVLVPPPASPAAGLTGAGVLAITACLLPPTLLMGGAFPFFVRLGAGEGRRIAGAFGRISAWNTAGGIVGSLLAPFLLLPGLGLHGALVSCVAANAVLAVAFLSRSLPLLGAGLASGALLAALVLTLQLTPRAPGTTGGKHLLFAHHGRQASAAAVWTPGGRMLYVDGDPEAATAGAPRETEELLAVLPLLLHPAPRRVLEVGLGSGITLATAARFPLEELDCVEIADSVLEATRFFAPDNEPVASRGDPRLRILRADGRAFLARQRTRYDVVLANTVQPWSLGATGLYSREYYARMARALRPGGLAVQWLPVDRIGADALAALLRTFYSVFAEGALYWGAGNVIAMGATGPLPETPSPGARTEEVDRLLERLALVRPADLRARRLAEAETVRAMLAGAALLEDDRPRLERLAARRRVPGGPGGELALLESVAEAGAAANPSAGPLRLFIQSLRARREGDDARADRLEELAEAGGLALAGRARAGRLAARAFEALEIGRLEAAEAGFREALAAAPGSREARLGLALLQAERGRLDAARERLEALLASDPGWAEAWYRMGLLEERSGDREAARRALDGALTANPFFPEVVANAGILAARSGDLASARAMLARLREVSPLGAPLLEQPLADAIAAAKRSRE